MEDSNKKLTESGVQLKILHGTDYVLEATSNIRKNFDTLRRYFTKRTPKSLMDNTYEQIAYIEDFTKEVHVILRKFGAHRSHQSNMLSRIRACSQEEAQELKRSSNQNISPSVKKTKRNNCQGALSSSTENLHQLLLKEVPAPRNGKEYEVSEVCEMYINFKSSKLTKTQILAFIIEKQWIPVRESRFHDSYRKQYQSLISENKASLAKNMKWASGPGRKRIVPATRMKETFSTKTVNQCHSVETVREVLQKERDNQIKEAGGCPDLHDPVTNMSATRYFNDLGCIPGTSFHREVNNKTRKRQIAENSFLNTVAFIFTTIVTHFIILNENKKFKSTLPSIETATPGAKELYKLVAKCNPGMKIRQVNPALVTNTDDTTIYAYSGTDRNKGKWYLCTDLSKSKKGSYSAHVSDDKNQVNLNGLRVRLTYTMNAIGWMAPVFITVYGLTERELPVSASKKGRLYVKIPGLCIAGMNNVDDLSCGNVCLMRKAETSVEKSHDSANFFWYNVNVKHPWMAGYMKRFFKQNPGETPDIEYTSVMWTDGGGTQLASTVDETNLEYLEKNRMHQNKHSASKTATEQACDAGDVFKNTKSINKNTSTGILNQEGHPFSQSMNDFFDELKKMHGVQLRKQKALIDFFARLPSILKRASDEAHVQSGFIRVGLIDKDSKNSPDLDAMICTCKNKEATSTPKFKNMIIKNFSALYEEQMEKGELSDEFMMKVGFEQDKDLDGNVVEKNASITNEKCQRTKQLSHPFQRDLRKEEIEMKESTKRAKYEKAKEKVDKLLNLNEELETRVKMVTGYTGSDEDFTISNVTPLMLQARSFRGEMLKAACYVRLHDVVKRSNRFPTLNKGKANEVNLLDGTVKPGCSNNYIAMLYRLRNEKVKMRAMCAYDDIEDDADIDSMDIDAEDDDDEDNSPVDYCFIIIFLPSSLLRFSIYP